MRKILLGILVLVFLVVDVALVDRFYTSRNYLVFDFLMGWRGAQALIFEGKNPYSEEVTNRIEMAVTGRPVSPDQCRPSFLYPIFVAFTIPHFLLPAPLALSLWVVTRQCYSSLPSGS